MSLIETFRYHSQVLAAKSTALEIVHHAGDRGFEREDIVEDFLSPILPQHLGIGKGEVSATNGRWSKQEDLIIYDRMTCPRLFVGTRSQIFPVESVAAVIEVKTKLDTKTIHEASENISQIKNLEKTGGSTRVGAGTISFGPPTPVFGALFAFELGVSIQTLRKSWEKSQSVKPPTQRINLTCVLGKLVVLYIDKTFHVWDQAGKDVLGKFYGMDSGEDSLLVFTLVLLRVLSEFSFGIPDLLKYFFSGGERLEFRNLYDDQQT